MDTSNQSSRNETLFAVGAILGIIALICSVIGIGLGVRAIDKAKGGGSASSSSKTAVTASVSLSEFKISPAKIVVAQGTTSLMINNDGSANHTFSVVDQGLKTNEIAAGGMSTIDLSSLVPGHYTVICDIPGHQQAGMKADLQVVAANAASGSTKAASTATTMNAADMEKTMEKSTKDYVAAVTGGKANTKGVGNQPLDPKILADGTKEFDLTAAVTDWEVSPGKTIKAWTYNGTVPGPAIKTNVGDKVRVVLTNNLPEPTVMHFHGVQDIPNAMDGVPDVTQPPIEPGKSFTYDFTTKTQSVGMYHSHYDAQVQVPNGLAGTFIVGDVPLPNNIKPDVTTPMMLNDAGVIGFSLNGKSFPATAPIVAKTGQWIEINYFNEGLLTHPMHTHGFQQWVVAKDGTKLDNPYYADTLSIAPGERYTVLVHADNPGVWAFHCHILTHAESSTGMFGMVTAIIVQ